MLSYLIVGLSLGGVDSLSVRGRVCHFDVGVSNLGHGVIVRGRTGSCSSAHGADAAQHASLRRPSAPAPPSTPRAEPDEYAEIESAGLPVTHVLPSLRHMSGTRPAVMPPMNHRSGSHRISRSTIGAAREEITGAGVPRRQARRRGREGHPRHPGPNSRLAQPVWATSGTWPAACPRADWWVRRCRRRRRRPPRRRCWPGRPPRGDRCAVAVPGG
ncbi:MAG: hypothetical protein QOC94_4680 [Actinoplanes sp.]|nr:hypothetical protein [Actinoplanes sp.]